MLSLFSTPTCTAIDHEVVKMSMPAKKTSAKSAQTKSVRRGAFTAGREVLHVSSGRNLRSGAQNASISMFVTQAKSTPPARSKPAMRNVAQSAEPEDDAFDRAIADALKAGLLDDMIAEALQEERDGETTPL